jgi:hypothetical protein
MLVLRVRGERHSSTDTSLSKKEIVFISVLRIRILRIRMSLGLLYPSPIPVVRGTDPDLDPDPSIIEPKKKKNLDICYFVTS